MPPVVGTDMMLASPLTYSVPLTTNSCCPPLTPPKANGPLASVFSTVPSSATESISDPVPVVTVKYSDALSPPRYWLSPAVPPELLPELPPELPDPPPLDPPEPPPEPEPPVHW